MRAGWPERTVSRSSAGMTSSPNSGLSGNQRSPTSSTGFEPVGVWSEASTSAGFAACSPVVVVAGSWRLTVSAFWYVSAVALDSRWSSRFCRVSPSVATASTADMTSAATANAIVIRARSPRRGRKRGRRNRYPGAQACSL